MKDENIVSEELEEEIEFDGHKIKNIKFDLEHINHGWDADNHDYNEEKRSDYTAQDVIDFFEQFGYYSIDWKEGQNKFEAEIKGQKYIRYVAYVTDHDSEEQKKIVIDIPEDFNNEGIIITIHWGKYDKQIWRIYYWWKRIG